jgi:hypothetical protein
MGMHTMSHTWRAARRAVGHEQLLTLLNNTNSSTAQVHSEEAYQLCIQKCGSAPGSQARQGPHDCLHEQARLMGREWETLPWHHSNGLQWKLLG